MLITWQELDRVQDTVHHVIPVSTQQLSLTQLPSAPDEQLLLWSLSSVSMRCGKLLRLTSFLSDWTVS